MSNNTELGFVSKEMDGIEISQFGLAIVEPEKVTEESLEFVIKQAARLNKCSKFIIGDAMIAAGERMEGDVWERFHEITGFDIPVLKQAVRVARAIPVEDRNEELSFEHHKICANLDPATRNKFLKLADEKKLTQAKLRKSILLGREATDEDMTEAPGGGHDNLSPHVNRIVTFGRKLEETGYLDNAEVEQLYAMHKDLLPALELHSKLVKKMTEKEMTSTDEIEEDFKSLNK